MNRRAEILQELAREICYYQGGYEDIADVYNSLEELIEMSGLEGIDLARAIYFGDITSWNDEMFYFDSYGNISSCSEREQESDILAQEEEIISDFISTFREQLEDFRDSLEELGVDIDNLD